jgi:hypothetical protein
MTCFIRLSGRGFDEFRRLLYFLLFLNIFELQQLFSVVSRCAQIFTVFLTIKQNTVRVPVSPVMNDAIDP